MGDWGTAPPAQLTQLTQYYVEETDGEPRPLMRAI